MGIDKDTVLTLYSYVWYITLSKGYNMHHLEITSIDDPEKVFTFNYNSDLSGDVRISEDAIVDEILIPGEVLVKFVAEYVRSRKIASIEQMDSYEVLGIPNDRP